MGFQFQCPRGHVLEADASTVGQAAACPHCGTPFLIPAPVAASAGQPRFTVGPHGAFAPTPSHSPAPGYPAPGSPAVPPGVMLPPSAAPMPGAANSSGLPVVGPKASSSISPSSISPGLFPQVGPGATATDSANAPGLPQIQIGGGSGPSVATSGPIVNQPKDELLHIPCPKGHELEVPLDMLEQEALCPTCQVQFRLRAKDSLEHKRRQQEAYERRQYKLGQSWLNWSIGIAVVVVLGLMVLIALKMSK